MWDLFTLNPKKYVHLLVRTVAAKHNVQNPSGSAWHWPARIFLGRVAVNVSLRAQEKLVNNLLNVHPFGVKAFKTTSTCVLCVETVPHQIYGLQCWGTGTVSWPVSSWSSWSSHGQVYFVAWVPSVAGVHRTPWGNASLVGAVGPRKCPASWTCMSQLMRFLKKRFSDSTSGCCLDKLDISICGN